MLNIGAVLLLLIGVADAISCQDPSDPHLEEQLPNQWVGYDVQYRCREGFTPTDGRATCTENGWSPNPLCKVIPPCNLPTVENADIIENQREVYNHGETVTYACRTNYRMEGERTITCRSGQWSPRTPTCIAIRCQDPNDSHLKDPLQNKRIGLSAQYRCKEGFTPTDHGWARCTENGWTPNPLCKEIRCENPYDPNLKERLPSKRIGDYVRYWCREGFTPTDGGQATCTENGWTPNPLCEEIRCENPNDPNLKRQLPSKRIGDYVRYKCGEGFTPTDGGQATCTENGWTPNPLCEEVTCQLPQVTGTTYPDAKRDRFSPGETVWVKCDRGRWFSYDDQQTQRRITCTGSGEWDPAAICQVIPPCNLPTTVENADITEKIQEVYNHGAEVTYACRTKYRMEGERTIGCRSGHWSPGTPTCIRVTCRLPQVTGNTYPYVSKDRFSPGETVTVKCDRGRWFSYGDRRTPKTITCTGSGEWDRAAICQVIPPCNIPTRVENADITENQREVYNHGAAVTYTCRTNYRMEGEGTIRCRSGQWSPRTPTCIAPVSSPLLSRECLSRGQQRVSCSAGEDGLHYSWSLDGLPLNDTRLLSGPSSGSDVTLEPDRSGLLTCSVRNNVSHAAANITLSECDVTGRIPIIAGSLSATALLLMVALGVYCAKKHKTSKDTTEAEDATYAEVSVQGEGEVEYAAVRVAPGPRRTQETNVDECVYAQPRRTRP